MFSAAAAAAIAALFHPLPASAAPNVPAPNVAPAIPDAGSRPTPIGTLLMPGQKAAGTPTTTTPVSLTGVPLAPILQEQEKKQNEINTLGDQLIKLGEERDLAKQQADTATTKLAEAEAALVKAQHDAVTAAAASMRDQAALPPGTIGSGLADLDALSRLQRGESASEEAADRQLALVTDAQTVAWAQQTTASASYTDLSQQWDRLNATIATKQKALDKWRAEHSDELSAAEASLNAEDQRLGANYLDGTSQGRGADPRAIAALTIALKQIGDPYVWSEEGPDEFDCSGLMQYAYHSNAAGRFPLQRVSRDQYWQLRDRVVDRYSLLPGDLLFFSSSNSWTGIHHVAMYAGDGMMVEAPRTGLNVRLTPVRWSRLFGATRVYGSLDHPTKGPDLNNLPAPGNDDGSDPTKTPTKPGTGGTKPPGGGGTTPPSDDPTTPPSDDPSTPPSDDPTTPPSDDPTTPPSDDPTTPPQEDPTTPPQEDPTTKPPDQDPTTPPETEPETPSEDTSTPASDPDESKAATPEESSSSSGN